MRLLFISNFYPPYELGGYEQWCHEVANSLRARGHAVRILTSTFGVPPGVGESTPHVKRRLHLEADIDYYKPADFFLHHAQQQQQNLAALRSEIAEFQPDLIMIWGMWNLSHNVAYWAEQMMPGKVAYFISNYWPIDEDPHTAYWNLPTERAALSGVKQVLRWAALNRLRREQYPPTLQFEHAVCCSKYVRDTLVEAGKLPAHAGVVYGGTDPAPFLSYSRLGEQEASSMSGPLRLLYFGRLIHDKGVHTALEALGILKRSGRLDGIELTILGSGHPDYEAHLHTLIDENNLQDSVEFVGKVARDEVPARLASFDVYLFTSIWPEPMARTMMEAMAAGLLVIGTEVGGQVEMLDNGANALTFPAEDARSLAAQIDRVAQNPALRHRLARAGQAMILERFTLTRMVDDLEQYLGEIVGAPVRTAVHGQADAHLMSV